jgi:GNAT superfamily N-acetyltransferase
MSEGRIHVGPATDPDRFLATDLLVWSAEVPAATAEQQLIGLTPGQRFAADAEGAAAGTYPGVYGVFPMTLSVPGPEAGTRQVSCAGLTFVGVHPDHRRQGVLTAMVRHHLEQVRDAGTHVSALHASEPAIYGRYGYGVASLELEVTLGQGATLVAPHLDDRAAMTSTRITTVSDPDVPERMRACHLACAEMGSVVGDAGYYARVCWQLPEHLRGREPARVLFARRDGVDVGFAMFRRAEKWERARATGELTVLVLVGDPAARLALMRRLVDFDLMTSVKVGTLGVEDPLLSWVGSPRGASDVATFDSLWIRLVDLPGALEDRAWSAPCDVVVEVVDTAAPWNQGRWRITAGEAGEASVRPTTSEAEVRLPVAALGAAYLGGSNLVAMHRAGLLEEGRRGAVAELWRALRTELAPTAAIGF